MAINFSVEQFKSALTNGGARPNQFAVYLNFPRGINSGLAGQRSQFLVTAAELPGQSIQYTPVYYRGREIKLAGDRQLAPMPMTILNDSDFSIRTALENWMNYMDNMFTKSGELVPGNYQTDMRIHQLDRNGKVLKLYTLQGVFPTDVGPVGLDFSTNDTISSFGVQFQYQSFRVDATPQEQLVAWTQGIAGSSAPV